MEQLETPLGSTKDETQFKAPTVLSLVYKYRKLSLFLFFLGMICATLLIYKLYPVIYYVMNKTLTKELQKQLVNLAFEYFIPQLFAFLVLAFIVYKGYKGGNFFLQLGTSSIVSLVIVLYNFVTANFGQMNMFLFILYLLGNIITIVFVQIVLSIIPSLILWIMSIFTDPEKRRRKREYRRNFKEQEKAFRNSSEDIEYSDEEDFEE